MTYHRGTLEEFNIWHSAAMISDDIPTPNGKIGFVNGKPAPNKQRTVAYSDAILHPSNADDYIWFYGTYVDVGKVSLSKAAVRAAGWFAAEEI